MLAQVKWVFNFVETGAENVKLVGDSHDLAGSD